MPVQFKCSGCGVGYEVDDDLAGKAIMCRECGVRGHVPGAAPAAATPPPAPPRPTIPFTCPKCRRQAQVPASALGQKIRCQGCGTLAPVKPADASPAAADGKAAAAKPIPGKPAAGVPAVGKAAAGAGLIAELSRRDFMPYAIFGALAVCSAATGAFLARWHPRRDRGPEDDKGPPFGKGKGKFKDGPPPDKPKDKDKGTQGPA